MNRKELIGTVIVGMALTTVVGTGAACNGGSGTGGTTGTTTTGTTATSTHATTGATTTTGTATTGATTTSTGGGTQLTVKNYLSWCNVSVNGGTASSAAVQTVTVPSGTVNLTATPLTTPAPGFQLYAHTWHHTSGDTGPGEAGTVTGMTSAATVMFPGTKCVWVCCPNAGTVTAAAPEGDCPMPGMDLCP